MPKMVRQLGVLSDGREHWCCDFSDTEVKAIADDEIEIIGTTPAKDRMDEVLSIDGWDLKSYKKNPVILPAHDYAAPAIGKATSIKIKDGKMVFRIKFPPEGDNPLADIYRKLYKGGFMNASSVGFVPVKWEYGDGEKEPYRTFIKQELLELSLVSVPANPEALVISRSVKPAVEKGIITDEELKMLQKALGGEDDPESGKQVDDGRTKKEKETVSGKESGKASASAITPEDYQQTVSKLKELGEIVDGLLEAIEELSSKDLFKSRVQKAIKDLQAEGFYGQLIFGSAVDKQPDAETSEKKEPVKIDKGELSGMVKTILKESK